MSFVEEDGRLLIGFFFFFFLFSRAEEDAWKHSTFKDAEKEVEDEEVNEEERMRAVSFLELARNMRVRFARYFILKSSFSLFVLSTFMLFKNFSFASLIF